MTKEERLLKLEELKKDYNTYKETKNLDDKVSIGFLEIYLLSVLLQDIGSISNAFRIATCFRAIEKMFEFDGLSIVLKLLMYVYDKKSNVLEIIECIFYLIEEKIKNKELKEND